MTQRKPEFRWTAACLALSAWAAQAQQVDGGAPPSGGLRPRLSVSQSWTDNLRLDDQNKDAALVTTVSPGLSYVKNSGSIRGSLDYALNGIAYVKTSVPSRFQNALSANLQAEVVPQTLVVDAQASIGQQNASAFGLQATPTLGAQGSVSALDNPNRRETGTLTVSPNLRTQLAGALAVDLRATASVTQVRGSALGDSHSRGATLRVNPLGGGVLRWYALANTQQVAPKESLSNHTRSVLGGVDYQPDPDWALNLNAGQEWNDYLDRASGATGRPTGGFGVEWTPTVRTRLSGNWQHHSYGDSHALSFQHRIRHAAVQASDSRSVSVGTAGAPGGIRTNYDLYFQLFASQEPDPVKRDTLVRAYITSLGLAPDALAAVGFLSSGPARLHNQSLSFTLQGIRANLTATLNRSITARVASGLNQGDLATNSAVEQRSYALTGSYQLTPVTGLALTASQQRSQGDSALAHTRLRSLLANLNTRLGARVSVQLGARHSRFASATPYTENAAYATLTQQF
ncbi:TIGR03016 family PEP-CTERM system-associated outer membrane protein [Roseateles sp. BYS87W]|uniref:TIGR03016 family PEP-CTERM system-associated outer membrane protein n=1 Tax=Pelomonas baiyunensis TaxID=3299026 RepID=A0ABW7GXM6_9BURK